MTGLAFGGALVVSQYVSAGPDTSDATPAGAPSTAASVPDASVPGTSVPATSVPEGADSAASEEPTAHAPSDPAVVALATLEALTEVSGDSAWEYRRDAFGEPWEDVDGNGCSTRNDILARDLDDPEFASDQCKVLAGTLVDPYDGRIVPFVFGQQTSQEVPIDHVVALAWAWRHGADRWGPERRLVFANDPQNLQAVAQENNQRKLAKGPAQWLPADAGRSCVYVERWVSVLAAYDLGINAADRATARTVLERC